MIHPTADVSPQASLGTATRVWHRAQICAGARVGEECIVGSEVYIDRGVVVGSRVKIQTAAQLYRGTVVEDGVFIGPMVCITNDKYPRAITPDGRLQTDADWEIKGVHIGYGASLGAGSTLLPGVSVGRFSMVAAGALVARNVPDHGLVAGTPARLVGYVCACGRRLRAGQPARRRVWLCDGCQREYLETAAGGEKPSGLVEVRV